MNKKPDIVTSDWNYFAEADLFNLNNFIEGYLSHHSGDDYGALFITKVNYRPVPQLIYCTPKIIYPFDATGHWRFPKAKIIERYEKLDGTNVFAYSYVDEKGEKFVSYKTRLKPFLSNSKFGPFADLWKDVTKDTRHRLEVAIKAQGMNVAFELWGARNPHLVKYDISLQASMLFVRKGQVILPPSQVNWYDGVGLPSAALTGAVEKGYVWTYRNTQEQIGAALKETEDGYLGQEGEVWYLLDESGVWNLYKLKPHEIEAIHWAAGGIGRNVIVATCHKACENWDDPTIENVMQVMLEDFNQQEIDKVYYSIEKHLGEVKQQYAFRQEVMEVYNIIGVSILMDKISVMRAMSSKFSKHDMGRVYSVIMSNVVS